MKKLSMQTPIIVAFLTILISSCQPSLSSSSTDVGYDIPQSTKYTYDDLLSKTETPTLNSVGKQKILVVPVEFTDFTAHALDLQYGAKIKRDIHTAFFGEVSQTGWQSVASFYRQSSYGKLMLEGEVTDWLSLNITSTELAQTYFYDDPTYYVVEQFYETADPELLKAYDQDQDGDVDALCFIYAVPYRDYGDLFWGYAYWYSGARNLEKPSPSAYVWASYKFMYEGYGEDQIDAHTYIHEVGHLLGLPDYYNYDATSKVSAAGHLDMMDRGVLDHNAFSKMALGWTTPKVVNQRFSETKITLNPFVSSGEFILIKNQWNGTPFDEYLLVEFYTPTGLNEKDSSPEGYAGASYIRGFSVPGIKIYHIDARLVRGYRNHYYGWEDFYYLSEVNDDTLMYSEVGASNTPKHSTDPQHYLVHLLEATNVFTFKGGARAKNDTLFKTGDSFTADRTFFKQDDRFNDLSPVGYQIYVDDVNLTKAHLTIKSL